MILPNRLIAMFGGFSLRGLECNLIFSGITQLEITSFVLQKSISNHFILTTMWKSDASCYDWYNYTVFVAFRTIIILALRLDKSINYDLHLTNDWDLLKGFFLFVIKCWIHEANIIGFSLVSIEENALIE